MGSVSSRLPSLGLFIGADILSEGAIFDAMLLTLIENKVVRVFVFENAYGNISDGEIPLSLSPMLRNSSDLM